MTQSGPVLGIDFGTTNSTMAVFDSAAGKARVVPDAEGEDKTPSVVYYGVDDVLVGMPALSHIREADPDEVADRAVVSVKRQLITPPWLALRDRAPIRPVEVASAILGKLRGDVRDRHAEWTADRAVLTCPAMFAGDERAAIVEAANLAGFADIELVEEPVAAALAFERAGGRVGCGILVYDFGGGTFDVAFVAREEEADRFYLAMEPDGDSACGGDDIDMALYRHWNAQAKEHLGHPVAVSDELIDLPFLAQCRGRKERLSMSPHATFSTLLETGEVFKSDIDRATFEQVILDQVENTVRITARMAQRARESGYDVDTLLLVGGSSQIPLVERRLLAALPGVQLEIWKHGDVAIALGAAYHAARIWSIAPAPAPAERVSDAVDRYREAVEVAWADRRVTTGEIDALTRRRHELGISEAEAASAEREVMGAVKEQRLAQVAAASVQPAQVDIGRTLVAAGAALQRLLGRARDWRSAPPPRWPPPSPMPPPRYPPPAAWPPPDPRLRR
jgi:molecular chaperone DnaK (HSP70)